jgi:MFS family permease
MLARFSLYGFLKNQRYFEPFLFLALLEKGMGFAEIGILVAVREICINLFEIPSGAAADVLGRRRAMVFSFVAYILSFAAFGLGQSFWHFIPAMVFFGLGDAFRTGTHKAIILDWLRGQGRQDEKTKIYGYTRSWSKIGSALSALIAAGLVFRGGNYTDIFWISIAPYVLNLVNLATYPRKLDGPAKVRRSLRTVVSHTWGVAKRIRNAPPLRRLLAESMGFEGVYASVKDYLQPVLVAAAIALPVLEGLETERRSALLVGLAYFLLFSLSSLASRQTHRLTRRWGGESTTARRLWWLFLTVFIVLLPLLWLRWHVGIVVGFLALAALQNLWRPVLVARFDDNSEPEIGATLLSVESQAKSIATMILAPLLGWILDLLTHGLDAGERTFWPVAVLGILAGLAMLATGRRSRRTPKEPREAQSGHQSIQ